MIVGRRARGVAVTSQDWLRPGAAEVAPGVFRIPLPLPNDGLRAVNVYAIVDDGQLVLIDGGWALDDEQEAFRTSLADIGFGLGDIKDFLVTHMHRDHYTQAIAIRRSHGARVQIGQGERDSLLTLVALQASGDRRESSTTARLLRSGAPDLASRLEEASRDQGLDPNWALPDNWLDNGEVVQVADRGLRVIETPGHTSGHVVFHDPAARILFAGDHVLPHITPSIGLEPKLVASPLANYLASLALMLTLPDAELFPAHGPVAPSVHIRVEELLKHHEERLDATAAAVEAGAATAFEVAGQLGWTRRLHRLPDLDVFNAALAVCETLAHLDVLIARGWLTVSTASGVAYFKRA